MITEWTLRNFKSIAGPAKLKIAPLTILAGANSSGKSTVLQSILMVAQTLRSQRDARVLLLNGELTRLGTFSDVLHKTTTDNARNVQIGFDLRLGRWSRIGRRSQRLELIPRAVGLALTFGGAHGNNLELKRFDLTVHSQQRPTVEQREARARPAQLSKSSLVINERRGRRDVPSELLDKQKISDDELTLRPAISGVLENTGEVPSGAFWSGPSRGREVRHAGAFPIGVEMRRFLPSRTISWFNQEAEGFRNLVDGSRYLLNRGARRSSNSRILADINDLFYGLDPSTKENFGILLESLIARASDNSSTSFSRSTRSNISSSFNDFDAVTGDLAAFLLGQAPEIRRSLAYELGTVQTQNLVRDLTRDLPENLDIVHLPLPDPIETSIGAIDRFFTQFIEYLGPLREEPLAVYNHPTSGNSTDVGLKGEYTAAVLHANKDKIITYWHPEFDEPVTAKLSQAVLDWLQYFGMADGVDTSEAGSQGYRLTVRHPDVSQDLDPTNVGVGVSQVLPIVVMGLIAEEGSTLLYEQPEIHLHPATQARIADFFLGLIRTQKQCIIETHSEHFVNRVRLRIAENEDPDDLIGSPGNVQILFAEKRAGSTQYREVEINEYGAIVDWPAGFFDESQREAEGLIRAALAKRDYNA